MDDKQLIVAVCAAICSDKSIKKIKTGVGQVMEASTLSAWTLYTFLFWYSHYFLSSSSSDAISRVLPTLFYWLFATYVCRCISNQYTLLDCAQSWLKKIHTFNWLWSVNDCFVTEVSWVCSCHTLADSSLYPSNTIDFCVKQPCQRSPTSADWCTLPDCESWVK